MSRFKDKLDEKTYENGPSCAIALFDTDVIHDTEIKVPADLLSRFIKLGEAYDLHYVSSFDIFDHLFFERDHCEGLREELIFLKEVTNDTLLHKHLDRILQLTVHCIERNDCKLLVNGN